MEANERTMWICHITKYIRKDFQVVIRCTALQIKMKHWHIKSPFVNFYLHAKFYHSKCIKWSQLMRVALLIRTLPRLSQLGMISKKYAT